MHMLHMHIIMVIVATVIRILGPLPSHRLPDLRLCVIIEVWKPFVKTHVF